MAFVEPRRLDSPSSPLKWMMKEAIATELAFGGCQFTSYLGMGFRVEMTKVETKRVQRRKLRFQSIDEVLTETDRIEQADHDGSLKCLGNWTPGQVLSHLAAWIEYGYDGYPIKKPPFILRWVLGLFVPKMLRDGMSPGVRIPGIPEGTIGMEPAPTSDAAERLRKAFQRLKRGDPAPYDSPAFGKMSHEDRIRLNLRHAELHMSFLDYPSS